MQAEQAEKGLSAITFLEQMDRSIPHTQEWYYQPGMGWLWTNSEIFPFLFRSETDEESAGWLYFGQLPDMEEASFYDYASGTWVTPDP